MLEYKNLNLNPDNKLSDDCTTRAICYCLKQPWETIHALQEKIAKELSEQYGEECQFNSSIVVEHLLASYGYVRQDIDSIELINFDKVIQDMGLKQAGPFMCWSTLGSHIVAVDNNYYIDNVNRGYLEVDSFFVKEGKE